MAGNVYEKKNKANSPTHWPKWCVHAHAQKRPNAYNLKKVWIEETNEKKRRAQHSLRELMSQPTQVA